MADQGKTESPKSVEYIDWPTPVEAINEQMKELCPIVITTIAAAPMRGGHDDFEFDRTHKLAATDGKLWNDTKTGLLGIYKASGHMYQTEDKALDYYLDQMKANCDTP